MEWVEQWEYDALKEKNDKAERILDLLYYLMFEEGQCAIEVQPRADEIRTLLREYRDG